MPKTTPQVNALLNAWSKKPQIPIANLTAKTVRESDKDVQKLQDPIESVGNFKEYISLTKIGEISIRVYTKKYRKE